MMLRRDCLVGEPGRSLFRELPLQHRHELLGRDIARRAERTQLYSVDPPFPSLALAYETLRLADAVGKVDLRQASTATRLAEHLQENLVLGRMNRLVHCVTGCNGLP